MATLFTVDDDHIECYLFTLNHADVYVRWVVA